MERIHDKETPIRVQAAVALSKLCGSEDPSDVEEGEQAAIDVLFDTLSCDPAAEVRRVALLNMPIAKHTLPCILARSRDTDTAMRRLVYSAVLEKNCTTPDGSVMDPLHVLAISQRELIRMALNSFSFQLFLPQVQSALLKTRVLQIVFDMLMVHEAVFLGKGGIGSERIIEFFAARAQRRKRSGPSVCRTVQAYISVPIFEQLVEATRDLGDDQEMVSPAHIIGMFADGTDPQKAVEVQGQTIDDGVHLDLAEDILKTLFKDDMQKEDKKVLCQILRRLHLPDKTIRFERSSCWCTTSLRADRSARKKYADKLAGFGEEEYRRLEQLHTLFKFLDEIVPLDDGKEMEPRERGGASGESVKKAIPVQNLSDEDDDDDGEEEEEETTPAPKRGGRARYVSKHFCEFV
ncbi:hypothetical protein L210DRAFT_3761543 [Boletus edulis BED1]|uniref:Nuclear condensin complex subunit 3 C-terminal domain-containing protein n=1 Tax=Boletus edulis BED1 TaxID=1328754 RepID=A0AAD4BRZ3_BOLED|nr:hypothetical protein L210DRAFT_3761543 [Boletus edulis BED1]